MAALAVIIDLVRAASLRPDALDRTGRLPLGVAAGLVVGVNVLAASSVVLTDGFPPLGTTVAVALIRWVGFSITTWFVIASFYRTSVGLPVVVNLVAVAHVGLLAALLPVPAAFQILAGLTWAAAIAVKGLAQEVGGDTRLAGASLALGFLGMVLLVGMLPIAALAPI